MVVRARHTERLRTTRRHAQAARIPEGRRCIVGDKHWLTPARLIGIMRARCPELADAASKELAALVKGRDEGIEALDALLRRYASNAGRAQSVPQAIRVVSARRRRAVGTLRKIVAMQEAARVAALPTAAELRGDPAVYDLPQMDRLRGKP